MNCVNPTNMVCYEYEDGSRRIISEQAACSNDWSDSISVDYCLGKPSRFYRRSDGLPLKSFSVGCGKCLLCRQRRGFEVGIRARCEAACYGEQDSCFITLTVDDEHMSKVFPEGILRHEPWQLFAKRLRKKIGPFRFLMCGEYGDHTKRPHYHAIVFGHNFVDGKCGEYSWSLSRKGIVRTLVKKRKEKKYKQHPIEVLQEAWSVDGKPLGFVKCGRVNDNRLMYVAGYVLKPGLEDDLQPDAIAVEKMSGYKLRNYVKWSRRPGLGGNWIDKFASTVYRYDGVDFENAPLLKRVVSAVVWNGKLVPFACRYFDDRLALQDEVKYDRLKAFRSEVGSLKETVARNARLREAELVGLMNKLEVLAKKVADRKRDLS